MIISIILIYLVIINIYLYNKERKKSLGFVSWSQYFFSLGFLLFFIAFFVVFLRILSFFRESSLLDLKLIFHNFNIIFIIIMILFFISLRKLIFFFAKISFFKLHYFYLSPENNKYYINYYKFYINIFYNSCVQIYKYLFWLDKIMLILLLLFFFKDCMLNNLILNDLLYFMKFYSLNKLLYIIVRFVAIKQELMLDYYLFNLCYIGGVSIDEGFFAETLSKKAYESKEYEENVIKV